MFDPFARFRHARQAKERKLINDAMRGEKFIPIAELSWDDVFVTGYPKSGNTWFQILVAILMFGADAKLTPFSVIGEVVPDLSARKFYRRHARTMFYKSHALPCPEYRRVVYLIRDGRDVMVSYKHYREVIDKAEYDFATFVSAETPLWPCHWSEHVEAWAANPFGAKILWIRYEDLVSDTAGELRRLCLFVGVERSGAQIDAAVRATALSALQRKERAEGNWDPAFQTEKLFFRRGTVGSHADEMPTNVLARFLDHARPTLERFGYMTPENAEQFGPSQKGALSRRT